MINLPRLPRSIAQLFRRLVGTGTAPALDARGLQELAATRPVLIIALGAPDPALPGEQVRLGAGGLEELVRDVPRDRSIVIHCG